MLPKSALSLTAILLLSVTSLHAIKFETLGYKSISMGGAAVASSTGSLAAYNNPALLGKTPYTVEVSMGVGVSEYDHGALASIQRLDDLGYIDTIDKASNDFTTLTQADLKNLVDGTDVLVDMNGDAVTIAPQAYIGAQIMGFGLGVYGSSDTAAIAIVDQQHTQLIFADSSNANTGYTKVEDDGTLVDSNFVDYNNYSVEIAINDGTTYLDTKGVALVEVPLAYGHNFKSGIGNIMVGGAVKYMYALTYTEKLKVDDSGEVDGTTKQDQTSSNFGVDLGLAYQPAFSYDLTFGLVAKNLNSPKFDFADGSSYTVNPLIRAGVAYNIFDSLQIAADFDITSNKTLNNAVESQMVGGGLNYEPFSNIFALSLRAGLMQNLHNNDKAGLIYTAGIGIGVKWIQLDLSGEMSGNQNTVQDVTVPQYAKVNLALVSRW